MAFTKETLPLFVGERQLTRPAGLQPFLEPEKRVHRLLPMDTKSALNSRLINSVVRTITILEYQAEYKTANVEWGSTILRRLLCQEGLDVGHLNKSNQLYKQSSFATSITMEWGNIPLPVADEDGKFPWLGERRYTRIAKLNRWACLSVVPCH